MKKVKQRSFTERLTKQERELITTISMFLLGREELKKLFWNVKSVRYNPKTQTLNIGISTIKGKLGTTLEKLRKTCKDLSDFLYDQGLTFRKAKIKFFVDKRDEDLEKMYSLLDQIEIK